MSRSLFPTVLTQRCLCLIGAIVLPNLALSQHTISGRVLNGQDQTPLPGTNVFLANTTKGTVTDAEGRFTLGNLPAAKYKLVISHLGFKTLATTIETPVEKPYRIVLKPDEHQINAITVRAKRRDVKWEEHVALFIKNFIGQSENARFCRLLNPNVLYFDYKPDGFVAHATDVLQIENEGLGYRIKFQLDTFSLNHHTHRIYFKGYSVFEPLTTPAKERTDYWSERRKRAYHGSLMHFMRALYDKQLSQQGFVLRYVQERHNRYGERRLSAIPADSMVRLTSAVSGRMADYPTLNYKRILDTIRSTPAQPLLAFNDLVEVCYVHEGQSYDYFRLRGRARLGSDKLQTSLIRLRQPAVAVQADGQFFEPDGISTEGYWSWELVAEELPVDYKPDR